MTKILLIGSTGMIGSRIAAEARSRGISLTEANRSGGEGKLALDASDSTALAAAAHGHDAIVVAISPPRDGSAPAPALLEVGASVIDAARTADVSRVLVVGGAGSLDVGDGSKVVDQAWFPEEVKAEALAHGELLELWQTQAGDLAWTYLSPPPMITPGERTGTYNVGIDQIVANENGESTVSAEDYAVALIDELDAGSHVRRRFTVANA